MSAIAPSSRRFRSAASSVGRSLTIVNKCTSRKPGFGLVHARVNHSLLSYTLPRAALLDRSPLNPHDEQRPTAGLLTLQLVHMVLAYP
jgi:hypothetical protein